MPDSNTLDRFVSWTLDYDGDIYGDERARLRWYEGIATTASVQWIVVPWTLAIMSWLTDRRGAVYLLIVAAVFYMPMALGTAYAVRTRIHPARLVWTRKRVVISLVTVAPMVALLIGLTRALDEGLDPAGVVGGLVGGSIGLVVALIVRAAVVKRRTRTAEAGNE